jgi:hypothetical protein
MAATASQLVLGISMETLVALITATAGIRGCRPDFVGSFAAER